MKPAHIVETPLGPMKLNDWANLNGMNERTARYRWEAGERDAMRLVKQGRATFRIHPRMTPQKRKYLLELAKYSMGQEDQGEILCDFFPCPRFYASWIMEELGLAK
jgi:hypothetical protein